MCRAGVHRSCASSNATPPLPSPISAVAIACPTSACCCARIGWMFDVVRLLERRHEDARSGRALLMHVVRDRRLVGVLHLLDHHPRFFLREHEPVAVVVVARVLVIEVRIHAVLIACPSSCTSDRAPAPDRRDSATAPAAPPSCRGSPSRRGSIRSPACARSAGSTGRCPLPSNGSSRRADRTDALPPPAWSRRLRSGRADPPASG